MVRGPTVGETTAVNRMGSLGVAILFRVREIVDRLAFAQNGLYSLVVAVFFRIADSTASSE